jgi:hypothetical protein
MFNQPTIVAHWLACAGVCKGDEDDDAEEACFMHGRAAAGMSERAENIHAPYNIHAAKVGY